MLWSSNQTMYDKRKGYHSSQNKCTKINLQALVYIDLGAEWAQGFSRGKWLSVIQEAK